MPAQSGIFSALSSETSGYYSSCSRPLAVGLSASLVSVWMTTASDGEEENADPLHQAMSRHDSSTV